MPSRSRSAPPTDQSRRLERGASKTPPAASTRPSNSSTAGNLPYQNTTDSVGRYFEQALGEAKIESSQELDLYDGEIEHFDIPASAEQPLPENSDLAVAILCVTEAISRNGAVKFSFYDAVQYNILLQSTVCRDSAWDTHPTLNIHRPGRPIYIPYVDYQTEVRDGNLYITGGLGHYVLAEARVERRDDGSGNYVQLNLYDSSASHVYHRRAQVEEIVQRLLDASWKDAKISEYRSSWVPVWQQSNNHTCGIHVILNAWMLAMGLEPRAEGSRLPNRFYQTASELISCAVHGAADYNTILAFFHSWRLLTDPWQQSPSERRFGKTQALHSVNLVSRMLYEREQVSPQTPRDGVGESHNPSDTPTPTQPLLPPKPALPPQDPSLTDYQPNLSHARRSSSSRGTDSTGRSNKENEVPGNTPMEDAAASEGWKLSFWPAMAERFPCRFLSERLFDLNNVWEVKQRLQTMEVDEMRLRHPIPQEMLCACISSVTEAISLNGYRTETYLSPQVAGAVFEASQRVPESFSWRRLTQAEVATVKMDSDLVETERRTQRVEKKQFAFYDSGSLQEALRGTLLNVENLALRLKKPILVPIEGNHLIYATPRLVPNATSTFPEVAHYWMDDERHAGLPVGAVRETLEAKAERVLCKLGWWLGNPNAVAFEHAWRPVTPVDPNLVVETAAQSHEIRVMHLLLTAWTLALGHQPPATPVVTHDHRRRYASAERLLVLAAHGLADAVTIHAALRCLGWIPDAIALPPPPESLRFNQTSLLAGSTRQRNHHAWLTARLRADAADAARNQYRRDETESRRAKDLTVEELRRLEHEYEATVFDEGPATVDAPADATLARDIIAYRVYVAEWDRICEANAVRARTAEVAWVAAETAQRGVLARLRPAPVTGPGMPAVAAGLSDLVAALNADDDASGYWSDALRDEVARADERALVKVRARFGVQSVANTDTQPVAPERSRGPGRIMVEWMMTEMLGELGRKHVAELEPSLEPEQVQMQTHIQAPDPQSGQKRAWKPKTREVKVDDKRLVVDVESEVYEAMQNVDARPGLHTVEPPILARLFKNPPTQPRAKNMKKKMVDAAELHFRLERKAERARQTELSPDLPDYVEE